MPRISALPTTAFPDLGHEVAAEFGGETHRLSLQQIRTLLAYAASEISYMGASVADMLDDLSNNKLDAATYDAFVNTIGTEIDDLETLIGTKLAKSQNLNDVANKGTARSNLGFPNAFAALSFLRANAGATAFEQRTPNQAAEDLSTVRFNGDQTSALTQAQRGQFAKNSGQAWEMIGSPIVLGANAATVDWLGLSAYRMLKLTANVRPVNADVGLNMRFGDTSFDAGPSYRRQLLYGQGTTIAANLATGVTSANLSLTTGNDSDTRNATVEVFISNFNTGSVAKWVSKFGNLAVGGSDTAGMITGNHTGGALSRLQVLFSAGLIAAGSHLVLEGLRG